MCDQCRRASARCRARRRWSLARQTSELGSGRSVYSCASGAKVGTTHGGTSHGATIHVPDGFAMLRSVPPRPDNSTRSFSGDRTASPAAQSWTSPIHRPTPGLDSSASARLVEP